MIYGYARVSTKGQDRYGNGLAVQEQQLRDAGAEEIYHDSFTGTAVSRPALDELLAAVSGGDTVVVTKLDRIARSAKGGIEIIDRLTAAGVTVRILNMGVFDNTPTGKLMRTMMLAFAEFERDMIVLRTQEGKQIARSKPGYVEGRPSLSSVISEEQFSKIFASEKKGLSVESLCKMYGISRSSYYRYKKKVGECA